MSADQHDNTRPIVPDDTAATRPLDESVPAGPVTENGTDAPPVSTGASAPFDATIPLTAAAPPPPAAFSATVSSSPYRPERPTRRPSIRWGGVVWGAILVVFALTMLWIVSARTRLVAAELWLQSLTPASAWTLGLVAAGAIIVILALLAVVRSAQRASRS